MRKKCYEDACLKYKLDEMRRAGKKNPRWHLSSHQRELLEVWGYKVTPYLYKIYTKSIPNVERKCGLLRDINWSRVCNHKRTIMRCLSSEEKKALRDAKVRFTPHTYEIKLKNSDDK